MVYLSLSCMLFFFLFIFFDILEIEEPTFYSSEMGTYTFRGIYASYTLSSLTLEIFMFLLGFGTLHWHCGVWERRLRCIFVHVALNVENYYVHYWFFHWIKLSIFSVVAVIRWDFWWDKSKWISCLYLICPCISKELFGTCGHLWCKQKLWLIRSNFCRCLHCSVKEDGFICLFFRFFHGLQSLCRVIHFILLGLHNCSRDCLGSMGRYLFTGYDSVGWDAF